MDNTIEPSEPAMTALMSLIVRHGGSLRIGPLLNLSDLAPDELRILLASLVERRRIAIAWRSMPRDSLPERLRLVDRVTITRWGRSRTPRPPRLHAVHPSLLPRGSRRRTMR